MSLHRVYGHDSLLSRIEAAVTANRFPHTVLLTGPRGVGKQRVALHIAEMLLCHDEGTPPGESCRSARQVRRLAHPDLHWFVPLVPRRRAGDPEKQIEETELALAELIGERRDDPIYGPIDPQASHPIAAARLLQRRVGMTPFQGQRKVVILGDADRLVVQEASQEAANALLKVLEEPPADTTFLLTSSVPDALLPTIRSRAVSLRVGPVRDRDVAEFLQDHRGMKAAEAEQAATLAQGSIGRALAAVEAQSAAEAAAKRFLAGVRRGAAGWAGEAMLQQPWGARGGFTAMLDSLALELRRELEEDVLKDKSNVDNNLRALRLVGEHRLAAQGNVNPQIAAAVLAYEIAEVL